MLQIAVVVSILLAALLLTIDTLLNLDKGWKIVPRVLYQAFILFSLGGTLYLTLQNTAMISMIGGFLMQMVQGRGNL